jgi:hypothetical protein
MSSHLEEPDDIDKDLDYEMIKESRKIYKI